MLDAPAPPSRHTSRTSQAASDAAAVTVLEEVEEAKELYSEDCVRSVDDCHHVVTIAADT